MTAKEYMDGIRSVIAHYEQTRDTTHPVVTFHLEDGDSFSVLQADNGPGELLTLHPYPKDVGDIIGADTLQPVTPRVVVVEPRRVVKVEIKFPKAPGITGTGFRIGEPPPTEDSSQV